MQKAPAITCAFLDIGGVLLTDGWDGRARKRAASHFKLDLAEMEERHHQTWDTLQAGKITLDQYFDWAVFFRKRSFTRSQFRRFMFAQSKPHPEMLELAAQLKLRHGLKIAVVSNEGRELNAHRIRTFGLNRFVDFFVSSCFVHLLKPDPDIFRIALDMAQTPAGQVVYLENTPLFVQVAETLGIRSILHTDWRSTREKLRPFGLSNGEQGVRGTA